MKIAVDFDGTIVEHKYPAIGKEYPGAIDTLKKLSKEGHAIILWTVREGEALTAAVKFCEERGLHFYAVNSDTPGNWSKDGPRKIRADLFIDDSNIGGIPDWGLLYQMVSSGKNWGDFMYSGTHRNRRRGPIGRLIDRCHKAKSKLRGGGVRYSQRPSKHW